MPTKRTRRSRGVAGISADAIDAYRQGDVVALHRALGLRPWDVSPLEVDDGPSPWPASAGGARSWPMAQVLRTELERLV